MGGQEDPDTLQLCSGWDGTRLDPQLETGEGRDVGRWGESMGWRPGMWVIIIATHHILGLSCPLVLCSLLPGRAM